MGWSSVFLKRIFHNKVFSTLKTWWFWLICSCFLYCEHSIGIHPLFWISDCSLKTLWSYQRNGIQPLSCSVFYWGSWSSIILLWFNSSVFCIELYDYLIPICISWDAIASKIRELQWNLYSVREYVAYILSLLPRTCRTYFNSDLREQSLGLFCNIALVVCCSRSGYCQAQSNSISRLAELALFSLLLC